MLTSVFAFFRFRGFSVSVCGRQHIFKPVSVQAMWWVQRELLLSVKQVSFLTRRACSGERKERKKRNPLVDLRDIEAGAQTSALRLGRPGNRHESPNDPFVGCKRRRRGRPRKRRREEPPNERRKEDHVGRVDRLIGQALPSIGTARQRGERPNLLAVTMHFRFWFLSLFLCLSLSRGAKSASYRPAHANRSPSHYIYGRIEFPIELPRRLRRPHSSTALALGIPLRGNYRSSHWLPLPESPGIEKVFILFFQNFF